MREVARRESGVRLVDAEAKLAAQSPQGAPGDDVFLDHVHLTLHGNYLLGVALFEQVREALPDAVRRRGSGRPVPSEEDVARRLVYTELDRYRIAETMQQRLRDAPFTNQPDHAEHVKRFADEITLLRDRGDSGAVDAAVREYEQALAGGRAHWSVRERYATIEKRIGNAAVAAAQWEILTRELPQYPAFQLQLSRALRDAGRLAEARAALQKVLDYQPDAPVTLVEARAARARAGARGGGDLGRTPGGVARPARRERADGARREPVPASPVRAPGARGSHPPSAACSRDRTGERRRPPRPRGPGDQATRRRT